MTLYFFINFDIPFVDFDFNIPKAHGENINIIFLSFIKLFISGSSQYGKEVFLHFQNAFTKIIV